MEGCVQEAKKKEEINHLGCCQEFEEDETEQHGVYKEIEKKNYR